MYLNGFQMHVFFLKFGSLTPIFTKIILQISYVFFLFITERFSFQIFIADELKKWARSAGRFEIFNTI